MTYSDWSSAKPIQKIFIGNLNSLMNVTKHQLNQLLNRIIPLSLTFLREDCSASEIQVVPKVGEPLYLETDDGFSAPLTLNFDPIVGFTTLVNKSWDYQKIKNHLHIINQFEPGSYSLIDVGANVGLFSRQLKSALGKKLQHIHSRLGKRKVLNRSEAQYLVNKRMGLFSDDKMVGSFLKRRTGL